MIYLAEFDVKEKWAQQIDLPTDMDRAAGVLFDIVRKRGVLMSRGIDVELEMAEDRAEGKAIVLVGGFRPVGRVKLTRVQSTRDKARKEGRDNG